jgi:hypothetical protein
LAKANALLNQLRDVVMPPSPQARRSLMDWSPKDWGRFTFG